MKRKSVESKGNKEKKKVSRPAGIGRRILHVVYWVLAVLAALLLLALIFRDFLIRKTVTAAASYAMGVEVTLDEVDTSLWNGTLQLSNLKVANPQGYTDPCMFQLEYLFVDVDLGTLFSKALAIDTLRISGLHAQGAIGSDGRLNLSVINSNVQQKFPPKTDSEPKEEKSAGEKKSDQTVLLRFLSIENSSAELREDSTGFLLRIPIDCEKSDLVLVRSDRTLTEKLDDFTKLVEAWSSGALHAGGALVDAGKSIINQGSDAGKSFATPVLDFFQNSLQELKK